MAFALAESTSLPASGRIMLFALVGILLVLLGVVVILAVALRQRPKGGRPRRKQDGEEHEALAEDADDARAGPRLACPSCRREYDGGLRFCPRDARALVSAAELSERSRSGGSVCPRCRRSFEPGLRYCPYDACDVVPAGVYEATRSESADDPPSGVLGRICPRCRRRYDLGASFCGRDGSELAVLN